MRYLTKVVASQVQRLDRLSEKVEVAVEGGEQILIIERPCFAGLP